MDAKGQRSTHLKKLGSCLRGITQSVPWGIVLWVQENAFLHHLSEDVETLRVQVPNVPNIRILAQNLYYNYYYPKPRYLIIGYLDPLGKECEKAAEVKFGASRACAAVQGLN